MLFLSFSKNSNAQIADGTFVPNFIAKDINGKTQNLYALLQDGYKVVIDVSATWCSPCWDYHLTGALEDLHRNYGPDGSKEVFVLFIEGDDGTTLEDLQGTGDNTYGDWTANTPYPIIDDGGFIGDLLEVAYYPTIYTVCSDGRIYESERLTTQGHYDFANELSCQAIKNDVAIGLKEKNLGFCQTPFNASVNITNAGTAAITSANITMEGCDECPISKTWEGNLNYFETTDVTFEDIFETESSANLTFKIDSEDGNLGNNNTSLEVSIGSIPSTTEWTIELFTDCFPDETSWEIKDGEGKIVAESPQYSDEGIEIIETISLPSDGCYTMILNDSYGDGLNGSSYGDCMIDGSFKCYSEFGEILMVDGVTAFSTLLETSEASTMVSIDELNVGQMTISPNPGKDFINISMEKIDAQSMSLDLINVTGQSLITRYFSNVQGDISETFDVSSFSKGIYFLKISLDDAFTTRKVVVE